MGFLYFVLKCVHVLAWPSFALGYPLCASIRAIETNSNHHMRKLITYWILFSLISLFELAFAKLIEWVPIWPYIKLVVICSLVLPRFKGAYYAYKSFVHPCLTVNLEEAIKKLSKPQETTILKTENFLSVAERYVKENGTEALEKLIATKGSIPKADVEEIKAIANAEEKVLAPAMQSKCKDPNFAQKDIKAVEPIKTNTASAVDPIPGKSHELPSSRIRQVESGEGGATQPSPAGTKGGYRIKGKMCYLRSEEERLKRLQEEEEARKLEEAEKRRKEEAERRKKLDEIAEKQRKKEQELEEKERLRREAILRGKPTDGPARPSELPGPGVGAGAGSARHPPLGGSMCLVSGDPRRQGRPQHLQNLIDGATVIMMIGSPQQPLVTDGTVVGRMILGPQRVTGVTVKTVALLVAAAVLEVEKISPGHHPGSIPVANAKHMEFSSLYCL